MRSHQLQFVFADSPQGGGGSTPTDESAGREFLLRTANSKKVTGLSASATDFGQLLEAVATPANLATALLNVVRNKGAPGVDGRSVKEVLGSAQLLLPRLQRALLDGTYQPGDVRRVWIPKPGGGERGLGIPNVVDRWVQQAVLQVLEPIFEPIPDLVSDLAARYPVALASGSLHPVIDAVLATKPPTFTRAPLPK